MTLAAWQQDFRSWLTDASEEAARRVGGDASRGLSVYQNNYRGQLIECLEHSFPQVRTLLGEDAFLHAVVTHINHHPPHAWTLDAYAYGFGDTLSVLFPHNPDVHELAWIENALAEAFVAHDAQPLPLDALASVDWDAARLRFAPVTASPLSRFAFTCGMAASSGRNAMCISPCIAATTTLAAPR